jgi:hypothetical protein
MAPLLSSKLSWLLVSGGVLCAGQSERATAMQWADYYAAVYRVPPELVQAIIEVESGWQPRAVSNKGAAGLMQLMPANRGDSRRNEPLRNRAKHSGRSRLPGPSVETVRRRAAPGDGGLRGWRTADSFGRPAVFRRQGIRVCKQSSAAVPAEWRETDANGASRPSQTQRR